MTELYPMLVDNPSHDNEVALATALTAAIFLPLWYIRRSVLLHLDYI